MISSKKSEDMLNNLNKMNNLNKIDEVPEENFSSHIVKT